MGNTHPFRFKQFSGKTSHTYLALLLLWSILITSCTKDDPKSAENRITSFQLHVEDAVYDGQIDQKTGRITFIFENELPVSSIPTIVFPSSSLIRPSQSSPQDFNKIIRYTVTAENGAEKAYTVIVETPTTDVGNIAPGAMELVATTFDGREVTIDWTDAADSDEIIYKIFKNAIEVGEYSASEAKIPFTYNQTEKIEIYAIDKMGGNSKLEINLETPKSELLFIRNSSGILFCIDTQVQDILWVKKTHDRFPAPPIINNEIIYGNETDLVGLNLLDGSEQQVIFERESNYYPTDFIYDQNTFFTKDFGAMYAYDLNTTKLKWTSPRGQAQLPSTMNDNLIYTTSYRDYDIEALNKNDGTMVWEFGLNYGKISGRPLVVDDAVLFAHSSGTIYSLDTVTGAVNWEVSGASGPTSLIEYNENIIVIGNRTIYALNNATGLELWREPYPDYITGSPFLHDGKLLVGRTGNGQGSMYAINPDTGKIIWERQVSDSISSSPVAYEGKVYCADQNGFLYCFSTDNGTQLWRITIGAYITTSPTFVKGNSEVIVYPTLLGFN